MHRLKSPECCVILTLSGRMDISEEHFRGFHKLDEIDNNANIGIRGFTT